MPEQTRAPAFIVGRYGKLVEGGINYFFPSATLQTTETGLVPLLLEKGKAHAKCHSELSR